MHGKSRESNHTIGGIWCDEGIRTIKCGPCGQQWKVHQENCKHSGRKGCGDDKVLALLNGKCLMMTCSQLSRLNSGHLQTDQVGNVYGQPGPCCGAEVMCSSVERLLGIFFACCRKIRMDGMLLGPVISWSASDVHEH